MTDISVIIPTLKPRDEVECIDHLESNSFSDYEVCLQSEPTATSARNAGIERAESDKLVFLDDDSRPREGYLARMSELFETETAVAGRTVHPRDDIFAGNLTKHYDFGDEPRYVTRFWGCNMGVRRAVFDEVGGWDEEIPWGHEELELAERVLRVSPIYYDPDLVVDHVYADSVSDYLTKTYRQEVERPYLWAKQGRSEREQWLMILADAVTPTNYIGLPLRSGLIHGAGTLAGAAGRVRGMRRQDAGPTD
ncbi:glycosyltransferase family 2 protein [Halorubrum sp. SP3]|nr:MULTISPECIES: glycosyltransferase [unclassified Halorubrum]TKX54917.1 glycosyltransferase family 2 protein [Halorubrum sp. SP3]TKX71551.1 glycosyltransferase family 2 protein [Halorubrum sp. SP9]